MWVSHTWSILNHLGYLYFLCLAQLPYPLWWLVWVGHHNVWVSWKNSKLVIRSSNMFWLSLERSISFGLLSTKWSKWITIETINNWSSKKLSIMNSRIVIDIDHLCVRRAIKALQTLLFLKSCLLLFNSLYKGKPHKIIFEALFTRVISIFLNILRWQN